MSSLTYLSFYSGTNVIRVSMSFKLQVALLIPSLADLDLLAVKSNWYIQAGKRSRRRL